MRIMCRRGFERDFAELLLEDYKASLKYLSDHPKPVSYTHLEILTMLAAGESNKEIGRALNISTGTVKAHLESLYRRLEVKNRETEE